MAQSEKKASCPACAHEFSIEPDADLQHLLCPHCEAEIPPQAIRGLAEVAEELALGFRPGQRLSNYVIESLLGSGGMAVVFRGRQLSLNRFVAIKILPKDLAKNKLFIQRFTSEAAVLANLNHPNIVSVIDRGREGETYFIVMEYVEGETLKDRLRREGHLAPDQVLRIADQVLAGLEYAHRRGVVHRDIKPGNLMINREEMVKIADFGLAHLAKSQGGLDVTRDNQTMGTLKYMAPEQLSSAKNIDGRTDIYSFGVCLYELLTGRLPLGMFKMPSEVDGTLDVRWDEIILRSLRMDADERYASAEEMARAVRELATTPRITQAQRERDEEAAAKVKGVTSLTACAACGHESAPTARQCEQCGADLSDLFDKCPSCKIENRVDVARCPGCGADLAGHRDQLRRVAEAMQSKAVQLASERQFDLALVQLRKLSRFNTREYAPIRESASVWIKRLTQRRERFFRQTYEAGQRMVAEGNAEQALDLWNVLPDGYEDVVARRKDLLAKIGQSEAAMAEGNRLYDSGDVSGAISQWERVVAFRPRNLDLHKRLAAARIQLGNLNLKRSYLKESSEAASQGNYAEALELCHKVLELDPDDASALLVEKELEAKKRESAESEAKAAPKVKKLPKAKREGPREPLNFTPIILLLVLLGVAALVFWIVYVHIPETRAENELRAETAFNHAMELKEKFKVGEAIKECRMIEKEFADTAYASQAHGLREELQKLSDRAYAKFKEVDDTARGGSLDSLKDAYRKLEQIIPAPPVAEVIECRDDAKKRLEELRKDIVSAEAQLAAQDEKSGHWRDALIHYDRAVNDFKSDDGTIKSNRARAQKRLDRFAAHLAAGQKAFDSSQWHEAHLAVAAALDLIPADPGAVRLLARIGPKLTPPPGMVYVPAGSYVVGGSEGNPQRTVEFPFGFFIDSTEVTRERYGEFLQDKGLPPPPGTSWREGGFPPQPGTEKLPVVNVTWSDAAAFARWAKCALPTEEQWEASCRGQKGQIYPWGNAWAPTGGEFGFGPAPVGRVASDLSPFGCVDMAGNVAEWTATKLTVGTPSPATAKSKQPALRIVKGSSWAGLEKDRPSVVIATPPKEGAADQTLLLTPDPVTPELAYRYPTNIEVEYLSVGSTDDSALVLVRKWMPTWDHWAECKFQVKIGDAINDKQNVVDDGPKPRHKMAMVDFSTSCVAVRQEPKAYLEARDPAGVKRRFDFASVRPAKANDFKDALSATDMALEQTASASTRMVGREDARYVNVGFRCVKMLWPLPPATPAEPKAAGK